MGRVRGINRFLINFSFFICIFLTSFSKNEITTIEALPQREKANLDIEVLKIKTEKITGVIYENEKKIIFDFKDLKKAAEKKKIITDSNNYEIFILENLDNAATYMKKNEKFKMNKIFEQGVKLRNGEKIKLKNISYSLIEQNREKVLEVSYDLKPETFYLGVINNKTGMIEKIYKAEFVQEKITAEYIGSISDFSYYISNSDDIIIEYNHLGDYTSTPMIIRFEQKYNSNSNLFPIIALGNENLWKKENHNGGLPVESSIENIQVEFNESSIIGKMTPQLKYKNSNPSGNLGQSKNIYFHNISGYSSEKIAIGAYETSKNEFIEAELSIQISSETIALMKQYAFNSENTGNELIEIPYKGLTNSNQLSLVLGSSNGNGYYNIPDKNLNTYKLNLPYPKIYVRRKIDDFSKHFDYDINGLKDHIIDENDITDENGNFNYSQSNYFVSLGTVSVNRKDMGNPLGVPAIGLGAKDEWASGKSSIDYISNIQFKFSDIPIYPYFVSKTEAPNNMKLLVKQITQIITGETAQKAVHLALITPGNSPIRSPNVTGQIKIAITKDLLKEIKIYADEKIEDIVEIPYLNDYKISLIPSSKDGNQSAKIPDETLGVVRSILYPKIKYKKKTKNENNIGKFIYDYKLNDLEIDERDLINNSDLNREMGFVHFYQKEKNSNDNLIPMVALGIKEEAPTGYLFKENTTSVYRNPYIAHYNENLKTYPYFKNLKGGVLDSRSNVFTGIQKDNENSNLGFWTYSADNKEEIFGDLIIKIKNENKKDFLAYARSIESERIETITKENIGFIEGIYLNEYDFSDSSRVIEISYPKLTIVKDIIENNDIEIEFKNNYIKGEEVKFDFAGNTTNPNIKVNLNSGQFMNGLELNDGKLEIAYDNNQLISMDMNSSGETKATIQESNLKMNISYNNDGLVSLSLNEWNGNSHILTITHKEKSDLIRRQYTVKLKTPGPTFEVISAQDLDFGTVLKGDNSKTATSKIIIKNLSSNPLTLKTSKPEVELTNGDSKITAGNFLVSDEIKDSNNGESHFILQSQLINTSTSTLEGEHNGQFYLNIELK